MDTRPRYHWLQKGLLIIGLALVALWAKADVESHAFQSAASNQLDMAARVSAEDSTAADMGDPARRDTPATRPPQPWTEMGPVIGRLEVARLGIAAVVAEGVGAQTLRHAVGHVSWSASPGGPGNCALAGHRDTFFRRLKAVRVNDVIRLVTPERTYVYQVEWVEVVAPGRIDVLDSTSTRSLTLITCYPFVFVGHAPRRFVVRARQVAAVAGARRVAGDPRCLAAAAAGPPTGGSFDETQSVLRHRDPFAHRRGRVEWGELWEQGAAFLDPECGRQGFDADNRYRCTC